MKTMFLTAMMMAAAFATQAADGYFRLDANMAKAQSKLTADPTSELTIGHPGWMKKNQEFVLTIAAKKAISDKDGWKTYKFAFTPEKSGTVFMAFLGQWAKTPEQRAWMLIDTFKINGKLAINGDFAKTFQDKKGKTIPNGFWLNGKAKYLPTAGENGKPAILVNHDNGGYYNLKVEAGKKYTIEVKVKTASPELLK